MQRRRFLALAATGVGTTAGCTDDTDYQSGNQNPDGDDSGGQDSDEALEILEHELVRENQGSRSEKVTVEGRAENTSDRQLSYVEVRARFYNEQGDQIETSLDNTNDLDAGQTWAFEIMFPGFGEDARAVADYDIGVGTEW